MYRFLYAGITGAISAVFLVPAILFLLKKQFPDGKRRWLCCLLSVYLAAVYDTVGLPNAYYIRFAPILKFDWVMHSLYEYYLFALNVLLFVPIGFLVTVLCRKYRSLWRTACLGFGLSLFIELAQILTYRTTDILDVVSNGMGMVLGYCLARLLLKFRPDWISPAQDGKEIGMVCLLTLLFMFFLYPWVSADVWRAVL